MGDSKITNKLFIKRPSYDTLIKYCLKDPLKETCGVLAGKNKTIEKVFPLANISDNPKFCYMIEPKEQLAVFKEIRKQGLECLAVFHSHIDSPAYPSERDIELAFYPDSSYIIVSLGISGFPEVRSFRIIEGEIQEEELEILD